MAINSQKHPNVESLSTLLRKAQFHWASLGESKKQILLQASEHLVSISPTLDAEAIFDALIEREKLSSTSLGHHIAAPHARIEGLEAPHLLFIQSQEGIDFSSPDDTLIYLFACLFLPEKSTNDDSFNEEMAHLAEALIHLLQAPKIQAAMQHAPKNLTILQQLLFQSLKVEQ